MPIRIAILGPTGYTGLELIELISGHPDLTLEYLGSARTPAPMIQTEFPRLNGRLGSHSGQCEPIDHDAIANRCRLAFLCLPHEASMQHTPALLDRGVKVVDLSAAYRLRDAAVYQGAYGHAHTDKGNLPAAVYGLPELFREQIRGASLVANPGCYPTGAALALSPFLRAGLIDTQSIIVNAASGASGAGREAKSHLMLVEAGNNFSAYGIGVHRHQPEIEQTLARAAGREAPRVLFVPHLLPIERGILETIYATPAAQARSLDTGGAQALLREAYKGERFVVVRDDAPTLRDVQRTNAVHINARVVGGRLVIIAAIDNLVKGASGQAIQNANLMLGLNEADGLS